MKQANSMNGFIEKIERLESFRLRCAVGRKALQSIEFCTDPQSLRTEYDWTERVGRVVNGRMEHALSEVQNISGTIERLKAGETLDDVQLFELKHLAITSRQIREAGAEWLDDLKEVVTVLDPNGEGIDTFYIYDSYDGDLADMRRRWKEPTAEQFAEMSEAEDRVRARLSKELKHWSDVLGRVLTELGLLDLRIAKWQMAEEEGLHRPDFSDDETSYQGLFHIETKRALTAKGHDYQPVDVSFRNTPTIVTGMNMGGKTVLLKALAEAQEMCQYGFFVPADVAVIMLKDSVMTCIDDTQSHTDGLSSFAAEMLTVDAIIREVESGRRVLALIDELARTTNPVEGRIIVSRVVERLQKAGASAFVTTHYDGIHGNYRRLRVRGLRDDCQINGVGDLARAIDYRLVETSEEEVPREALRVAEMLGIKIFL